jgi:hypothetical protein
MQRQRRTLCSQGPRLEPIWAQLQREPEMRRLNLPPFNTSLTILSDSGPGLGGCGIDGLAASGDGGSDDPGPDGCAPVGGPVDGPACAPVDSTESDGEYGLIGSPGSDLDGLGCPEYGHGCSRSSPGQVSGEEGL